MALPKLETCPVCGYSLQGLPDRHHCPECGFAYDRNTQVFRQANRTLILEVTVGIIGLMVSVLGLVALDAVASIMAILIFTVWVCAAGRRLLTGERNMAVLSQAGVTITEPGKEQQHIPWRDMGRIHQSSINGTVHFENRQGRKLLSLPSEFLGAQRRTRQFVQSAKLWHEEAST
jgi:hypothetical protein